MVDAPLRAPVALPGQRPGPVPRVSILIPAYNAADTVGEALESALSQVPPPHEVIVSDDGSDDDLDGALKPFLGRLRVVRGPNGGLAVARNRAAAVATGDLLALLDADDVWLPGRAAAFASAGVSRPDLSVLTTDAVETRDGVRTPGTYYGIRDFPTERQDLAILASNFIFGAGAIRTEAFTAAGGYRAGIRYAEDWDLFIRLLLTGHRAGLIEQPLYDYRRRAGSLTDQKVELSLAVLALLAKARSRGLTPEQQRRLKLTQQQWRETAARAARRTGDPRRRRLALRAAVGSRATPAMRARLLAATLLPGNLVPGRPRRR
ncbi:MAG TPA: glycosyltransferase [Propionibacteriaceae bacterium]|nr:glycosyltransferase [Propionibacteriaceae bacterium]